MVNVNWLVGVGVPLIALAITLLKRGKNQGSMEAEVREVRQDVKDIKNMMPVCQTERRTIEGDLYDKMRDFSTIQAAHGVKLESLHDRMRRVENGGGAA